MILMEVTDSTDHMGEDDTKYTLYIIVLFFFVKLNICHELLIVMTDMRYVALRETHPRVRQPVSQSNKRVNYLCGQELSKL